MSAEFFPVRSELILGGQKSGKSRRAEQLAAAWLAGSSGHRAVMIATVRAGDAEMQARIARHRDDRAQRVPGMTVVEAPLDPAGALRRLDDAGTLVVIDCLTLWLTNRLMPFDGEAGAAPWHEDVAADLAAAVATASGPVVVVSNEIGLGVIPLGREVREFVDALGRLNQILASACARVTLMAAGLPLTLKG